MSYIPSLSRLTQLAGAHVPVPLVATYGFISSFFSIFPPAIGGAGMLWIVLYQIASMLKMTKHEPSTPATLIRHCVTSFLGLYAVTFLIIAPLHVRALMRLQDRLSADATREESLMQKYLPDESLGSLENSVKNRILRHEGVVKDKPGSPANHEAVDPKKALPQSGAPAAPVATENDGKPAPAQAETPQTENEPATSTPPADKTRLQKLLEHLPHHEPQTEHHSP